MVNEDLTPVALTPVAPVHAVDAKIKRGVYYAEK